MRAPVVDEGSVRDLIRDLQRALLQSDVNVQLVLEISNRVKNRILREELPPGISRHEHAVRVLYEELTSLVGEEAKEISIERRRPAVLMLVGIQGCGKTTSAVKLAYYVKGKGLRSALICADKFRAGAYAQLKQLADVVGVPVYGNGKDVVDVALRGIEKFREEGYDIVIIDTAGRHKEEKGLIEEMKEMAEEVKPDEVILVVDGTIGQQAFAQAKAFHEATKIGSIFVAKLDSSARGGGALSSVVATGAKIKFIGTGEKVTDIEPFDPPRFVGRLLGMGDLKGLIDRVKEAEVKVTQERVQAILSGKFTMDDLYVQLKSLRKLGPLRRVLKTLPMLGYTLPKEMVDIAQDKLDRWCYIIQSMTKEERKDPRIIRGSRLRRIAYGSGVSEKDVKELVRHYSLMRSLLKKFLKQRRRLLPKLPYA